MIRPLLAAALFATILAVPAFAQEDDTKQPGPATDATTSMDRRLGNDQIPQSKTLSNTEVLRLQNQQQSGTGSQEQGPGATTTTTPSNGGPFPGNENNGTR